MNDAALLELIESQGKIITDTTCCVAQLLQLIKEDREMIEKLTRKLNDMCRVDISTN